MKTLKQILEEKEKLKNYKVEIFLQVTKVIKEYDMTEGGDHADKLIDELESLLSDYGYDVTKSELSGINEIAESMNESATATDDVDTGVLNRYADEELAYDVVDIFDVVERRINKLSANDRDKAIFMLKEKLDNWSNETTNVVFRKMDDEIIAFFPNLEEQEGMVLSYMHIGQHSEASLDLIDELEPATEEEYSELYDELVNRVGYTLEMMPDGIMYKKRTADVTLGYNGGYVDSMVVDFTNIIELDNVINDITLERGLSDMELSIEDDGQFNKTEKELLVGRGYIFV